MKLPGGYNSYGQPLTSIRHPSTSWCSNSSQRSRRRKTGTPLSHAMPSASAKSTYSVSFWKRQRTRKWYGFTKSCTAWDVQNSGINDLSTGAGFCGKYACKRAEKLSSRKSLLNIFWYTSGYRIYSIHIRDQLRRSGWCALTALCSLEKLLWLVLNPHLVAHLLVI